MGFIVGIILEFVTAHTRLSVVESFETPPQNIRASRWRLAALLLFLAFACLLLTAAILHTAAGKPQLGEIFGWSGIVCFELSVLCGLRYAVVNRREST